MSNLTIRERRKNMKRVKHPINLYHISLKNHNGEVFHPRIPEVYNNDEDDTISRVCFSSTISGAYRAITFEDTCGEECYVHIPTNIDSLIKRGSVYKPNTNLVWDADFTNEYWVRRPVKLKCIGKAKFYYKDRSSWIGPWRPRVDFKWIEKYTENDKRRV